MSRTLRGLGGSLQWAERFRPPRRLSPVRLCQEVSDSVLVFQKPAAGAPPSPMAPRVPPTHPAPTSQLPLDAAGGSRSPDLAISRSHWGTQFCASCVREVQTSRFHGNVVWEQGNQWMLFSQINLVSLLRLQAPLSSLVFSHLASSAASRSVCCLPGRVPGGPPRQSCGGPRGVLVYVSVPLSGILNQWHNTRLPGPATFAWDPACAVSGGRDDPPPSPPPHRGRGASAGRVSELSLGLSVRYEGVANIRCAPWALRPAHTRQHTQAHTHRHTHTLQYTH